jgi:hypothetical protein
MTLQPGERTSISFPVPDDWNFADQFHITEVPPPQTAPVDDRARALGLPDGLRVDEGTRRQWRCACCHRMQPAGSTMVWVPDSVSLRDSRSSVVESARLSAHNGNSSGWCLSCAGSFGNPLAKFTAETGIPVWAVLLPVILIGAGLIMLLLT